MLSTPFGPHIINYEPSRGFIVPNFTTYDGTSDPFDHIILSNQPTWPDFLVVPLPPKEFREQFSGSIGSLCGTLPMFSSPQAEHKHHVETQDAGKRVPQRLHKTVRASSAPSGVLQHGCHPTDLKVKHLSRHTVF
ncbi:hypothetical protein AAG906_004114 [Vitis piasezkii]